MPITIRFVLHQRPARKWTEVESPFVGWKQYYRPPWLMIIHILDVIILFNIYVRIILPSIKYTFLARNLYTKNLCPDNDIFAPFARISDITDWVEQFTDNLEKMITRSFMQLYLVDEFKPYQFDIIWRNGSKSSYSDVQVDLTLFHHISKLSLSTDFYSVSPHSKIPGCTKWHVSTEILPNEGSYTYTDIPLITRNRCPGVFMSLITEKTTPTQSLPTPSVKLINANRKHVHLETPKKTSKFIKSRSIPEQKPVKRVHSSTGSSRKLMADFPQDLLPNRKLPQAVLLSSNSMSLAALSFIGTIYLAISFYRHIKQHNHWHATDSIYKDLTLYDQLHFSLGFWNPLHLCTETFLFICSLFCMAEAQIMTQYPSHRMLTLFAFAFFTTYVIACRWFIYTPKFYQLITIIRVVMVQIITIIIGLSPLVVGLMFFGSFFFGFVSDISRSFFRFFQMFVGATFGDDLFFMFTYYTDGTDLFNLLALIYITAVAIVAGYVCFPSFTSTISFLHKTEVIPAEEREKLERAEE